MNTGIIIVFHNNEALINKEIFIKYIQQLTNIVFCLVNNESKDNTYAILKEMKRQSQNIHIVNIKKHQSELKMRDQQLEKLKLELQQQKHK